MTEDPSVTAPATAVNGRFGGYEVVSLLGKGGMGEVFRAHDPKLGRDVAIKTLPAASASEQEWLARFRREARTLASLNHPNIAVIHGLEESAGVHYLIMELVEGDTLGDLVTRRGALPLADVLKIGMQIADALEAAHQKSIIHRDIKPANIKITPAGRVKVLDFGLAKRSVTASADQEPTETAFSVLGHIVGTPGYMSPEQVRGRAVDERTDIWAVGCVLFELVAGKRTFRGDTSTETLAAILEREPAWDQLPSSLPVKMRDVLQQCLQKDADKRPASATELKARLLEIERSPGRSWQLPPLGLGRLARWIIATAAAAAIGTVVYLTYSPAAGGSNASAPGVPGVIKPLTSLPGWEIQPAWSRDGSLVAFSNNANGSMDVFAMGSAGGDPMRLTTGDADEIAPRWSPDGANMVYAADQGTGTNIYVMPALGGAGRRIAETGLSALLRFVDALGLLGSMPWSPDGKTVLFARVTPPGDTAIWRINIDTSELAQVTFPEKGDSDFTATWSFDGAQIAFMRRHEGVGQLWVMPAAGGAGRKLFDDPTYADPAWSSDGKRLIFTSARGGLVNLWDIVVDTGQTRQLTNGPGWDLFAASSSTGRTAFTVFSHQVDFYEATIGSKASDRRLTTHTGESFHPSFAPDGRRLVYQSDRTGASSEIWMLDLDTNKETQLTNNTDVDVAPDWSPDGKEIAFASTRSGKPQVWLMTADGGSPHLLNDAVLPPAGGGWMDAQVIPRWSPDGKAIAYIAATDRGSELWRADRDGRNAKAVKSGVLYFDWFRDSRHIVFSSAADAATEVRAVDLETGRETTLLKTSAIELAVSRGSEEPTLLYTHAPSHFGMNLYTLGLRAGPDGMPRTVGAPVQITNGGAEWHVHKGQWTPDGKRVVYTRDADQGNLFTIDNPK